MFLFVRRLTGHLWISLLAGWAFAFYPFAVVTAEHPAFVHGWPFVLLAWRVLEIWGSPPLGMGSGPERPRSSRRPGRRTTSWSGA